LSINDDHGLTHVARHYFRIAQFPVLINYNIVETILSIVIAISVTAMGLLVRDGSGS